jgi:hypothetical protein
MPILKIPCRVQKPLGNLLKIYMGSKSILKKTFIKFELYLTLIKI